MGGNLMIPASIFELVKNDIHLVEECMSIQADQDFPDIQAALKHLINSGGKRIRPALTVLTGKILESNHEQVITLAAAIEMLHTATLVHDDLIDGALLRRGNPTLNSRWSPAATVLTGDYLFARAAGLAAQANSLSAMRLFSETLAIIVNGEITQLFTKDNAQESASRPSYYNRINAKTASLFRTSMMVAALVSPANEEIVNAVGRYGYGVGMAFQIVDDVLDFTGNQMAVGKPLGSDLRQGIITLPVIYYLESHPDNPDFQTIINKTAQQENLENLVKSIRNSKAIEQSLDEARNFAEQAAMEIKRLPECRERQALEDLANFIVDRNM
jgi:geranylgeranyl pyrophosphate synthase